MTASPAFDARPQRAPRLIPLIVACALFMEQLDATIIATALPAIAEQLDADPLHLSLAITAYLLSLAIFIPLSGWIADRHGARRVFRTAILVFTAGSICCGLAQDIGQLVAARALQGVGGALMTPVGRLVLLRTIPKHLLVGAMAFVTVPALVAPIMGPPVGGLIVTYASWRWIFWINVPIGLLGFWLVSRYIGDLRTTAAPRLDLLGWLLLGGGVAGVMLGFESIGKQVVPAWMSLATVGFGGALLAGYVRHERRDAAPIIRLSLLRLGTFRASVVGGSLFRVGVGAFTLLLPMMLQLGFGMSPLQSGLITFASALGALVMKTLAPRIVRLYGFRRLLIGNTVVCSAALVLYGAFRPDMSLAWLIGVLLISGFLRSLHFTCVNAIAYSDVDDARMSHATSFTSTAQQLALSIGVGVGAQMLNLSLALRGGAQIAPIDFTFAFAVVAAVSLLSITSFLRLPDDAGASISGHRPAEPA